MSKPCKNCGAELPDEASFCPRCATSQIEKTEITPPRRWRKKALLAALAVLVLAAAALAIFLPHRPKTYEGGAYVTYPDKDGTYELLVTTWMRGIEEKEPEERRTESLSPDETSALPALLGVYKDGVLADADEFLAKVERCTLTGEPNENGALELGTPEQREMFAPAAMEADVFFTGSSGTNDIIWTLEMKNGDTIRLRQTYEIIPLVHQVYTAEDAPMDTLEELNALLARIETEVPADTIVDIYLPPVTYTGELTMASRAVNLYGCTDGSGRTVLEGSLAVRTHEPDNVMLHDLDFVGTGGTGLTASASVVIWNCSFTGYDIGALVEDGGMIGVEACTFRENGIGFCYDTHSYSSFKSGFPDCILENNGIGVQFLNLPGQVPLDFFGCVFSGNGMDIDNPMGYPIDTSNVTFK